MNAAMPDLGALLFPTLLSAAVPLTTTTDGHSIRISARCAPAGATCPDCGTFTERVHSTYLRRLSDLPVSGRAVTLELRVRRFRCTAEQCPRLTFAEQADGLTRRHGRATERLRTALGALGLALAGRAGARLAHTLGIPISRSTVLRRVMDLPDPAATEPRAIGVDDFALRRGHVYGTVIIDADTHQVLDLLPERDAATLTPWLAAHPAIEVLCRDRAGSYADAARAAAPQALQALQAADRFHLWHNLTTAVEKTAAAHRGCLRLPPPAPEPQPAWEHPPTPSPPTKPNEPSGKFAERARAHHRLVRDLLDQDLGIRQIARHLGWGRHTVQRYARAEHWQDLVAGPGRPRAGKLTPYKPYLEQRWAAAGGRVEILTLHREITARGWSGSYSSVRDWVRRALPSPPGATRPPAPLTARQATGLLTRHPATLTEEEVLRRKALLGHCPELATAAELTGAFAEMLTTLAGEELPQWIERAAASALPGISTFATGLLGDYDAVLAGLSTDWNSGPVEGTVNRIKMLKRQMFGRAGFPLLRKRVLLT